MSDSISIRLLEVSPEEGGTLLLVVVVQLQHLCIGTTHCSTGPPEGGIWGQRGYIQPAWHVAWMSYTSAEAQSAWTLESIQAIASAHHPTLHLIAGTQAATQHSIQQQHASKESGLPNDLPASLSDRKCEQLMTPVNLSRCCT